MDKYEGAKLGGGWRILQILLVFLAAILVLWGFYYSATCFLSEPPICLTLMDAVPYFIYSFILLTGAIVTEFKSKISSQEPLEEAKFKADRLEKVKRGMGFLIIAFSLLFILSWYDETFGKCLC